MTVSSLLKKIPGLLLRTALLLLGLVFALSLVAVALLLLVLWGARALWARLTGRPVQPLVFSVLRNARWQRFHRPGQAAPGARADVIDVESRTVDTGPGDRLGR